MGGPKAARPAPRRGAPRRPPGGGRTGGTRRNPPQGRARGALRRARNPTRQHTREAAARAAAAAALAGAPLATAKRACYRAGGGWPEACGRGRPAQAKTRRQRRGWGPAACQGRRRDAWAAHRRSPHDRRNLVAAARGQSGTRAGPRDRSQGATERTATSAHPIRVCTQGRSPFLILIL